MEKLYYSFDDYIKDVRQIYRELNLAGWCPDLVVGLPRGGLIAAVQLSHLLKANFATVGISTRDNATSQLDINDVIGFVDKINQGKRLLFVDDILDSGKTIDILKQHLEKNGVREKYKIATLFFNPSNEYKLTPDYFCTLIDRQHDARWIDFWWENDCFQTTD